MCNTFWYCKWQICHLASLHISYLDLFYSLPHHYYTPLYMYDTNCDYMIVTEEVFGCWVVLCLDQCLRKKHSRSYGLGIHTCIQLQPNWEQLKPERKSITESFYVVSVIGYTPDIIDSLKLLVVEGQTHITISVSRLHVDCVLSHFVWLRGWTTLLCWNSAESCYLSTSLLAYLCVVHWANPP